MNEWDEFQAAPKTSAWDEFDTAPQHSVVSDFFRSIPGGLVGGLANFLTAQGQAAQTEMGQPVTPGPQKTDAAPTTSAGKFGASIGEALGNPVSYVGPGSLPLKVGTSVLSALGGEAGAQAAEGTKYENAARIGGSLAGGVAGVKALGQAAPKAALPIAEELKSAAISGGKFGGYDAARASGLVLDDRVMPNFAGAVKNELESRGFDPDTARQVFKRLERMQTPGDTTTANDLDALRQNLNRAAGERNPPAIPGGVGKPTPNAAAATIVAQRLRKYVESMPISHTVAGDPLAYRNAISEANQNYAAGERIGDFDARLTKAENSTDRQIAGNLASRIKIKAGQMLDNPDKLKGLTDSEKSQLQTINSGTLASNALRQIGRGHGVLPLMLNTSVAVGTGGAFAPWQIALALGLLGAKKGSEALTKSHANTLAEMLAKRSPEYQQRLANLPPFDPSANYAVPFRSLMLGLPQ